MALRNPLGSVSALSLAADPAALITAATIAGVAVTVSAAVFTYRKYKAYEVKKHRREIEHVNQLYQRHLMRIVISEYDDIQGFPPIFKLTQNENSSEAESMHLTDEQINDIGKSLPRGTDIILSMYRESIINAILKLKDYYFSRHERDDITAGVISYLLYMLQTKCLNFEGYAYDIAYLNAISSFITSYASIKEREHSQEFSRLNPVFSYLTTAKQVLEKHKESLSLEEMIGELRDSCTHNSNHMLRCFAKVISKDKHWPLIDTAAIDELSDGIIRREYINKEIKGLVLSKHHSKKLLTSVFSGWLVQLSKYYIQTLDPDFKIDNKDIISPSNLFVLPSDSRYASLISEKELSHMDKRELKEIEETIASISCQFEKAQNFITTSLDPASRHKLPVMVPVKDPKTILQRSALIASFATLIHQVISLQYLCTHLLKSTKQLGELYVKNPKHFCRIFYVLEMLCGKIKENINSTKKTMTLIHRMDDNTMQLELQEILPDQIKKIMTTCYATVSRQGALIKDYRNRVAKNLNPDEPTFKSVKMEMFEVAGALASIYDMDKAVDRVHQHKKIRNKKQNKVISAQVASNIKNNVEADSQYNIDVKVLSQKIQALKADIVTTILDANIGQDQAILHKLIQPILELQSKAEQLATENVIDSERQEKLACVLILIQLLFAKTKGFVSQGYAQRKESVQQFVWDVSSEIDKKSNSHFIDMHRDESTKFFYNLCHHTLFQTDSRRKLTEYKEQCDLLVQEYAKS